MLYNTYYILYMMIVYILIPRGSHYVYCMCCTRLWIFLWTIPHAPVSMQCCSTDWSTIRRKMTPLEKESGTYSVRICVQLSVHVWLALNLNFPQYRPYIIDLESTNGTYINNKRIEPARYFELIEQVYVHGSTSYKPHSFVHVYVHSVHTLCVLSVLSGNSFE